MKNAVVISFVLMLAISGCSRKNNYFQSAVTQAKMGNFNGAIQQLEKARNSCPNSARIHYGLGVLYLEKGELNSALAEFNKGVDFDKNYNVNIDTHNLSILDAAQLNTDWQINKDLTLKAQHIFTREQIISKEYSVEGIKYLWRCINYKRIGDNIIKDCKTDEEKIFALFDWTYRNISVAHPPEKSFFALPLDVMLRGYGVCDKSAWVFCSLVAQTVGPIENIFVLVDPQTGESPHTVAIVFLNGKWVVFDTYNGIVFRMKDGKTLAGLDDIIDNPSLTHTSQFYKNGVDKCFEKGIIDVEFEAEAGLPRMEIAQKVIDEILPNHPKVYRDVYEEICYALKTMHTDIPNPFALPCQVKDREYKVDLWFLAFLLRPYYSEGLYKKEIDHAFEEYRGARLQFLLGNYREALSQFDALLKNCKNRDCSDDEEYFKCLCYFEMKEYPVCIKQLQGYINKYPQGKWVVGAIYHLARSYEAQDLSQQALDEYKKIESNANVQQRMGDLNASHK